ncbi:MAG: ATP synthase subunit I [Clostridioides sp.]|nr:ATP synthase subunit I [Clostridioides sp.]
MDPKLKEQVTNVTKGMFVYAIIASIILFVFQKLDTPMFLGVIFGSIIASLTFRLMAINIESAFKNVGTSTDISNPKAKLALGNFGRMFIYIAVIFVSIKSKHLNVLGTALGLIGPQFVIFFNKLVLKNIKERRKNN